MNGIQRLRTRIRAHGNTLARRWYLLVLTILCMGPVFYAAHVATGIYYVSADVLFLPPPAAVGGNSLRADPGRTVYYAAIVERQFNGEEGLSVPRSTSAPLYGTGIRSGYAVYLPNAGGQWQTNFNRPLITVEVVGETSQIVQEQLDGIVARLQTLALVPQLELGVKPESYISTEISPAKPNIAHMGIRNSRAEVALGLITVGLSIAVPLVGDRLIIIFERKFRRKTPADRPEEGPKAVAQGSLFHTS